MNICLKTCAQDANPTTVILVLEKRLPHRVAKACNISCTFQVKKASDHYILDIKASGDIDIICQRCLESFVYAYDNQTKIAVCPNGLVAERLMASFECIDGDQLVDLNEILIDDLHLQLPEKHDDVLRCNPDMSQLICD